MLKLTFLGTGTSQGLPMIACPCEVCRSADPRDKRLRTSALVQVVPDSTPVSRSPRPGLPTIMTTHSEAGERPLNIVIDAGPDFRTQMLRAGVDRLDAILLTHEHKDHTGGLDDVRAYNYFTDRPVDVWTTRRVQEAVMHDYAYAFGPHPYPGAPQLALHTIPKGVAGDGCDMAAGNEGVAGSGAVRSGAVAGSDHFAGVGIANVDDTGGAAFFRVEQRAEGPVPAYIHADLVAKERPVADGGFGVDVVPIFGLHSQLPVTGFRIREAAGATGESAAAGGVMGGVADSVTGGMTGNVTGNVASGMTGGVTGEVAEGVRGGVAGGDLAYLTDFNHVDDSELAKLRGVRVLVVNALAHHPHPTHFNLAQALEIARKVGAERTYLTHVSHRMGFYAAVQPTLPEGVFLAYDGLEVEV